PEEDPKAPDDRLRSRADPLDDVTDAERSREVGADAFCLAFGRYRPPGRRLIHLDRKSAAEHDHERGDADDEDAEWEGRGAAARIRRADPLLCCDRDYG
ncbi:MAG TPA: hypothetical protein VG408_01005, partial [Actinomycetota bacterium]|nr:hypothetical protein [Actinomycetota bacterium]